MGRRGDEFLIILDVNAVFASEASPLLQAGVGEPAEPVPA
jgi:hypothetical protein